MDMTQNLGMYQEVFPGAPGLGHMPRAMKSDDMTDMGIVNRLKAAVQQGMISPQAAEFLMSDLLGGSQEVVRGMPMPRNMPDLASTFPYSLTRGLLEGE